MLQLLIVASVGLATPPQQQTNPVPPPPEPQAQTQPQVDPTNAPPPPKHERHKRKNDGKAVGQTNEPMGVLPPGAPGTPDPTIPTGTPPR